MIAVVDAIHIDEVVGEPPRDDGQKQVCILGPDIAEGVGNVARTDPDGPRPRSGEASATLIRS